jgi:hypothetical protein
VTETDARTSPQPLLLDAEQASARLGTDSNGRPLVSAHWLRRKAGKRLIPCTFIGTRPRWSEQDLLDLIEQRRLAPAASRRT